MGSIEVHSSPDSEEPEGEPSPDGEPSPIRNPGPPALAIHEVRMYGRPWYRHVSNSLAPGTWHSLGNPGSVHAWKLWKGTRKVALSFRKKMLASTPLREANSGRIEQPGAARDWWRQGRTGHTLRTLACQINARTCTSHCVTHRISCPCSLCMSFPPPRACSHHYSKGEWVLEAGLPLPASAPPCHPT